MKKLRRLLEAHWRLVGGITLGIFVLCFLLLWQLGSLTGGLSSDELQQLSFSGSWHNIFHDPLNAPLTVIQWLLLTVFGRHGQTIIRLPSVLFGLLAFAAFAYVLRRWYGIRSAGFGLILFATSSWYLHVSRHASPDVLYLWAMPMLLATHIAWERHAKQLIVTFLAVVMLGVLLYIPGMFWLILVSLGLQPQHLTGGWRRLKQSWQRIALVALFLVIIAPLIYAIISHPSLAATWLGLPKTFSDPSEIPRRLVQSVSFLVWHGPLTPQLWLDRLPVLDVFTAAMALLGAFFYLKHLSAPRTRLLAGLFLVGAVFFALGGPVGYSLLVPLVFLVAAGGVGYLLHEWLRVFPRNPLARSTGYTLISLAIVLSCSYNLRSYFIAWPHNQQTVSTFRGRP